jgi:phage-related protein (TIGR01555 family)
MTHGYKLSERAAAAEARSRVRPRTGKKRQPKPAVVPLRTVEQDAEDAKPKGLTISAAALWEARRSGRDAPTPELTFARPVPPPGVLPAAIAMDNLPAMAPMMSWALQGVLHEGLLFLGYPYLAQLSQRAEYRRMAEIWAEHATRKWIKFRGPDDDLKAIETYWEGKRVDGEQITTGLNVRATFHKVAEVDAMFGRAQIHIRMSDKPSTAELATPLVVSSAKISRAKPIQSLKVVEPMWSYPGVYNASDPLDDTFYKPTKWYVYGLTIDDSRFLTFVGREVPDMLKPAYAFGGLSLTQMAKPYVDNWLRTRQAVSDITTAYSQMILKTDMGATLMGGDGQALYARADMFNATRDNRGLMLLDKDSEEFENVSAPLSGLHELQAQSQEQMSSVSGIPLVILLGVTPSGLNASSDGEIRSFYAAVKAYQEKTFRPNLQRLLDLSCLSLFGRLRPDITFEFLDLWETSDVERATMRKTDADTDVALSGAGAIGPEDIRKRISEDEESPYHGIDMGALPEPVEDDPEPPVAEPAPDA